MSKIRIISLIFGIYSLYLTLKIYRGAKWKKFNFIIFASFSIFLIIVSLNPNFIKLIAGMFQMQHEQRGGTFTLLIFSSLILWFLIFHYRVKLDEYGYRFDLLIRSLIREEIKAELEKYIRDKEVMVVIPAHNEADNLRELLPKIPNQIDGKEVAVLVIDDGSSDNTLEVINSMGYYCVKNKINRGQGAASKVGYDLMQKYNIKIGITMDSDSQHQPDDIERLVRPILRNQYDLVIGSRFLNSNVRKRSLRNIGVVLFSKIINILSGLKLTDCSSGFKAFDMTQMKKLKLIEDQFQSAEVIIEAAKKGLRIGEVEILHKNRLYGNSKKGKNWKYSLGFANSILKTWWR